MGFLIVVCLIISLPISILALVGMISIMYFYGSISKDGK